MNFSMAAIITLWFAITSVDAFTPPTKCRHSTSYAQSRKCSPSVLSMLLKKSKFDTIVTTNQQKKDLGYDDRSGRFFEISATDGEEDISSASSDITGTGIVATLSGEDANRRTTSTTSTNNDIPPMPTDGFIGMNITGEINGVKMTSSKETIKRTTKNKSDSDDADDNVFSSVELDGMVQDYSTNNKPGTSSSSSGGGGGGLADRITNAGAVSAAAMATAAVNAAVSMKSLTAPSVEKSYISLDSSSTVTDEEGLPLVYDKDLIEKYWKKERGALNQRWSYFVGKAVPFFTKLVTLFISEGEINERHIPGLSRQARLDLQDLGPTFIKAGQMMSVRPDVLPQATLDELTKLQDAVIPFDTQIAVKQIEEELGGPLGQFFTSISEEPVAAASLAQVYLATLNDGKDTRVAVKVQRPNILSTVSKDLYVLRRAAEVFQGLVERFAPQQRTNYVGLLNEWAIGFYTELDFSNVSPRLLVSFASTSFNCATTSLIIILCNLHVIGGKESG